MGRWVGLIAGAEAAAFGLGGLVATSGATTSMAFLVVAAVEIPALCSAQWIVLRDHVPDLRWWLWTLATGSIAAVTWGAAIVATSGSEGGVASQEPSIWLQAIAYVALGAAAGFLMGLAQWAVLRGHVQPGAWIGWSTLAWATGMPASSLITGSLPPDAGMAAGAIYGLCGGGAMGAVVALLLVPAVRGLRPLGMFR